LTFEVRDPDPRNAARLVNAYADAFVDFRRDLDVASIQRVISDVEQQLVVLSEEGDPGQQQVVEDLTKSLQQLRTVQALQNSNATVVQSALGAGKVANQPLEAAVAGAALGLALGIALALLLEALDRRARSAAEIAHRLGLPLLGRLPSPVTRGRASSGLVMLQHPDSAEAEAFRIARTNIEHAAAAHHRSIMLNAVELEADMTPAIAANLALALARNSTHTILVDLDLRRGPVGRLFDQQHHAGVTEVVIDQLDLDDALVTVWSGEAQSFRRGVHHAEPRPSREGVLELLPRGRTPPSVGELVASPRLHDLVATLRDRAPLVVIHGPPLLGTADALSLTAVVDGLIVVAGVGLVRRDVLSDLGDDLDAVVEMLGVIVTGGGHPAGGPRSRRRGGSRPRGLITARRASRNGTPAREAAQILTPR
jgi:Mrp family chromosome partitioning ATPase